MIMKDLRPLVVKLRMPAGRFTALEHGKVGELPTSYNSNQSETFHLTAARTVRGCWHNY